MRPAPARWAEFMAGKEGTEKSPLSSAGVEVKVGGGARNEGATAGLDGALRKDGGGMAFRSRSAFACARGARSGSIGSCFSSSLLASVCSFSSTMLGVPGAKTSSAMIFSSSSTASCSATSGACDGELLIVGFEAERNHGMFHVVGGILYRKKVKLATSSERPTSILRCDSWLWYIQAKAVLYAAKRPALYLKCPGRSLVFL